MIDICIYYCFCLKFQIFHTIMKKLQNPTTYFFQQAENIENPYEKEI